MAGSCGVSEWELQSAQPSSAYCLLGTWHPSWDADHPDTCLHLLTLAHMFVHHRGHNAGEHGITGLLSEKLAEWAQQCISEELKASAPCGGLFLCDSVQNREERLHLQLLWTSWVCVYHDMWRSSTLAAWKWPWYHYLPATVTTSYWANSNYRTRRNRAIGQPIKRLPRDLTGLLGICCLFIGSH